MAKLHLNNMLKWKKIGNKRDLGIRSLRHLVKFLMKVRVLNYSLLGHKRTCLPPTLGKRKIVEKIAVSVMS